MHNTYEDIFLNYTLKYWLVSVNDTLRYTNKIALFCIFTLHFYLCFPFTVLQLFFHCVFLVGWLVGWWWWWVLFVVVFLPWETWCLKEETFSQTRTFCWSLRQHPLHQFRVKGLKVIRQSCKNSGHPVNFKESVVWINTLIFFLLIYLICL